MYVSPAKAEVLTGLSRFKIILGWLGLTKDDEKLCMGEITVV